MHEGDGFQKLLEKACFIFKLLAGPSRSEEPVLTDGKRSNWPFFYVSRSSMEQFLLFN